MWSETSGVHGRRPSLVDRILLRKKLEDSLIFLRRSECVLHRRDFHHFNTFVSGLSK